MPRHNYYAPTIRELLFDALIELQSNPEKYDNITMDDLIEKVNDWADSPFDRERIESLVEKLINSESVGIEANDKGEQFFHLKLDPEYVLDEKILVRFQSFADEFYKGDLQQALFGAQAVAVKTQTLFS